MTHLELENLASEFLEGRLDASQRGAVEVHLGECASCRELIADLRRVMELCQAAEELEPSPWLVPKILRATVGEVKPTIAERVAALLRPSAKPRLAYALAMAVFSFSIIINAAGVNLNEFTAADLNPRNWFHEANRTGHLLYARAEKFYYDLRVVYEIESRLRQFRSQPSEAGPEAPRKDAAPGGSTERGQPEGKQLASVGGMRDLAADSYRAASYLASSRSNTQ